MNNIIQWCNENNGFISALLSFLTVLISVVAIAISIKMARLPFKKKLKLSGTIGYAMRTDTDSVEVAGLYVNVCNIGNRPVSIKYLGLCISKKGKKDDCLYNIDGSNSCDSPLMPAESFVVMYPAEKLMRSLQGIDRNRIVYYCIEDSEGLKQKKKCDSVGGVLHELDL